MLWTRAAGAVTKDMGDLVRIILRIVEQFQGLVYQIFEPPRLNVMV
jgi:hypothetical protein